jgi:predicted nucleic acid-binding Zn ribbon protein
MKDARGQRKSEREFYRVADLQRCAVCGRWFIRRKDTVCSRDCAEKAEAPENMSS